LDAEESPAEDDCKRQDKKAFGLKHRIVDLLNSLGKPENSRE
jgi:hypothetical protein